MVFLEFINVDLTRNPVKPGAFANKAIKAGTLILLERRLNASKPEPYPYSSRFHYSCQPNTVHLDYRDVRIYVKTTRDIAGGEELTRILNNDLQYMTTSERALVMRDFAGKDRCSCDLCSLPAHQRRVSDLRRFLLRRLLAMLTGQDLENVPTVFKERIPSTKDIRESIHQSIIVAELGEVEGAYAGATPLAMWTHAVSLYIRMACQEGWSCISTKGMACLKEWLDRAEAHIKRFTNDDPEKCDAYMDCQAFFARQGIWRGRWPPMVGLKLFEGLRRTENAARRLEGPIIEGPD